MLYRCIDARLSRSLIELKLASVQRHPVDAHPKAGLVIDEPFDSRAFAGALSDAQDAARRIGWSASAERYGAQPFLYEGRMRAAEAILVAAAERARRRPIAGKVTPASAELIYLRESGRVRGATMGSR